MPPWPPYVRCWGQSGKHMLPVSFSAFDPIAEVLGLEGERHKPSYRSVIPYVQLSR
jgi:hypothetical protein